MAKLLISTEINPQGNLVLGGGWAAAANQNQVWSLEELWDHIEENANEAVAC